MSDSDAMPFPDVQTLPGSGTPIWRRIRRWALPVLGLVVLALLLSHAHKVDWAGAWQALRRYSPGVLLAALALCTASHALYGCYDLIGRHHTRHGLPRWRSWAIAVTSYAFNLNLGSLVGGVAMRARLYARAGLDETTVAQIVGLSLATNWLGYGLVAGCVFASGVVKLPSESTLGEGAFRALGLLMLLLAVAYVLACAKMQGRQWKVRGRRVQLPSPRLALVQLGVAAANWALMASAMYLLLGGQVPYSVTLGVLLAASVVGVVTPIPAGLGVLEAVYLALLSGSVRQGALMGALLAYRALYYLVPLGGGLVLYVLLERYASAHPPPAADGNQELSPPPLR
ncbi:Inner membrane protein YbhN [Variovorax sp. PBL-H6]|uniref:lysylphosphatidylglycerol synthase transmembrane domain-containing protein n=1 Tax=Variovorax sp. PBL-H6 TaxID=434009 RepID=UPI001319995C|nr:lysylphosphatidylglycerol synthase domain-containing protein [Variovorax sp. PBL-H6]VTU21236.1 Inner membrane protein YbhN [Variovorax sp. PBL-H6]